jgi:hypothetical protein
MYTITMQDDGNVVIRNNAGVAVWAIFGVANAPAFFVAL